MAQIGVDIGSFVFTKATKTIVFSGVTIDDIQQIKIGVDQGALNGADTDIFNPAAGTAKSGVLVGSTLTLNHDTNTVDYVDDLAGIRLVICVNLPNVDELISFQKDAIATKVSIDTVDPSNNEPLPIALYDEDGMQGTPTNPLGASLFDQATGAAAIIDLNGAIKTGEATIIRGDKFDGSALNPRQWKVQVVGSGVIEGNAEGIYGTQRFRTGTTANSEVRVMSTLPARFMIGQFNIAHFGIQFPASIFTDPNVIFRFGTFDPLELSYDTATIIGNNTVRNGSFWEFSDLKWWSVGILQGVETYRKEEVDWIGLQKDDFIPAPLLSVFETQYNAGTVFYSQNQKFVNRLITGVPYSGRYDLHIGYEILNINGNTNDNHIDTRAGGVYRIGLEHEETTPHALTAATGVVKTGAGYISAGSIARTGSGGGAGEVRLYDGVDATGRLIGVINVGGDDTKPIPIQGTFYKALYYERTGNGTNIINLSIG